MGIKSECEQLLANHWARDEIIDQCISTTHAQLIEAYGKAIASKFETGDNLTISDVWTFLIAVWELPANGAQYLVAQNRMLHDFFELKVDHFLNPSPFLATPIAVLTLALILAVITSRS